MEGGKIRNYFLFLVLVFLIVPISVNAKDLTTDLTNYWSFDDDADAECGSINGSVTGATLDTSTYKVGNGSYDFDGSSDYIVMGDQSDFAWLHGASNVSGFTWTINFWYKIRVAEPDTINVLFGTQPGSSAYNGIFMGYDDRSSQSMTRAFNFMIAKNSVGNPVVYKIVDEFFPNDTNWHMVTLTYDQSLASNNLKVYLDGSYKFSDNKNAGNTPSTGSSANPLHIGSVSTGLSYFFDGNIDELGIWDAVFSQTQINKLYNSGNGLEYSSFTNSHFQITAINYDDSSLTNFSVLINETDLYNTTNGIIITEFNQSQGFTMDMEVRSTENGGYFNKTYSHNISSDLVATLVQTEINFSAFEFITNNQLYGTFLNETNELSPPLFWKTGTYNITFSNDSYFDKTQQFNVSALFNGTLNITGVYDSIINISATNGYSGQSIYNFTGWAYNINQTYNTSFEPVGNYSEVPALNGSDYRIFINHSDYAISLTDNFRNITVSENTYNLTFNLWSKNSIRIKIYDEQTTSLITETNISIVLTGNESENTYYTTTGTYFLENLTDGFYTLKFAGGNYTTKTYSVTVADKSTQRLDAYLSSNYETVTFTISDDLTGSTIEGASFTASRLLNSTWTVTESKLSDITGRVQITYLPNVKYRFTIVKDGYISKSFDLDPVIFESYSVPLTRATSGSNNADFYQVNVVYYPSSFWNDAQNNLTFLFSSPLGSLESYGFNITYPGEETVNMNGSNSIGETFTVSCNISGALILSTVNITYWYDSSIGEYKQFEAVHSIMGGTNVGNNTISHIRAGDLGKIGVIEKVFIGLLFVMIFVGLAFLLGGLQVASVVIMLSFGLFTWLGFFPLWSVLPALLVSFILITGGDG